ncbi:UNVERIFIED_CONTAM: hypothetical protein NCL1_38595 [Trichonephila clavipes]
MELIPKKERPFRNFCCGYTFLSLLLLIPDQRLWTSENIIIRFWVTCIIVTNGANELAITFCNSPRVALINPHS